MMNKKEDIKYLELFDDYKELTHKKLCMSLDRCIGQMSKYIKEFTYKFPSPSSVDQKYQAIGNTEWTSGFYTGMLWLAYEMKNNEIFKEVAQIHNQSYHERIDNKICVDHHDMGFIYSLSSVACYKITNDENAKKTALMAADHLKTRYREKGQFIQAWGSLDGEDNYRLIVDCLLNLPLLYWASEVSGDNTYREIADKHFNTTINVIFREDASTYHTYYFDKQTGAPVRGETSQGFSNESTWSRGQAWAIYGLILNYHYNKDPRVSSLWEKVTNYFINRTGEDKVAYWDLVFTDGDEPRDSSATAIAICGLISAYEAGIADEKYLNIAKSMLNCLIDQYQVTQHDNSNGILLHGTYAKKAKVGVDECCIWGDYFFMEAIVRLLKSWKMYW